MDIDFEDTPGGAQVSIRLTEAELEALTRGKITVTLPGGTPGTSGVAQIVLAGPT